MNFFSEKKIKERNSDREGEKGRTRGRKEQVKAEATAQTIPFIIIMNEHITGIYHLSRII